MIVLGVVLLGVIIGGMIAACCKGGKLDIVQYVAGYAIVFALVGLFATFLIYCAAL